MIAVAAGFVVLLLVVGIAVLLSYEILPPPGNAPVVVDQERLTYASTPCVMFNTIDRELVGNRAEIEDPTKEIQLLSYADERKIADVNADPKWKRDTTCNLAVGFDQIVTRWMRLRGYRSRWAEDGHWRW